MTRNTSKVLKSTYKHNFNRYVYFNTLIQRNDSLKLFENSSIFYLTRDTLLEDKTITNLNGMTPYFSDSNFCYQINNNTNNITWRYNNIDDSIKINLNSLSSCYKGEKIISDFYDLRKGQLSIISIDIKNKQVDTLINLNTYLNFKVEEKLCNANTLSGHVFNTDSDKIGYFFFKINKVLFIDIKTKLVTEIKTIGNDKIPEIISRTKKFKDGSFISMCNDDDFVTNINAARLLKDKVYVLSSIQNNKINIDIFDTNTKKYINSILLNTNLKNEKGIDFYITEKKIFLVTNKNTFYAYNFDK